MCEKQKQGLFYPLKSNTLENKKSQSAHSYLVFIGKIFFYLRHIDSHSLVSGDKDDVLSMFFYFLFC